MNPSYSAQALNNELDAFDDWFQGLDQNDTFAEPDPSAMRVIVNAAIEISEGASGDSDSDSDDDEFKCRRKRVVERRRSGALERIFQPVAPKPPLSNTAASAVTARTNGRTTNSSNAMIGSATQSKARDVAAKRLESKSKSRERRLSISSSLDQFLDTDTVASPTTDSGSRSSGEKSRTVTSSLSPKKLAISQCRRGSLGAIQEQTEAPKKELSSRRLSMGDTPQKKDDLAMSEHGSISRRREETQRSRLKKDDLSRSEHGMGVSRRRRDELGSSAHGIVSRLYDHDAYRDKDELSRKSNDKDDNDRTRRIAVDSSPSSGLRSRDEESKSATACPGSIKDERRTRSESEEPTSRSIYHRSNSEGSTGQRRTREREGKSRSTHRRAEEQTSPSDSNKDKIASPSKSNDRDDRNRARRTADVRSSSLNPRSRDVDLKGNVMSPRSIKDTVKPHPPYRRSKSDQATSQSTHRRSREADGKSRSTHRRVEEQGSKSVHDRSFQEIPKLPRRSEESNCGRERPCSDDRERSISDPEPRQEARPSRDVMSRGSSDRSDRRAMSKDPSSRRDKNREQGARRERSVGPVGRRDKNAELAGSRERSTDLTCNKNKSKGSSSRTDRSADPDSVGNKIRESSSRRERSVDPRSRLDKASESSRRRGMSVEPSNRGRRKPDLLSQSEHGSRRRSARNSESEQDQGSESRDNRTVLLRVRA